MGGLAGASFNLSGHSQPLRVIGMRMSAATLPTFRLQPLLGRNFSAEEELEGRDNVAILSYGLWQRLFGGRSDVLHRTIQLTGRPVTVIGVMPRASPFPEGWEIFVPFVPTQRILRDLEGGIVHAFGRLKPGTTLAQAQKEMASIAGRFAQENPSSRGWSARVYPIMDTVVGEVRPVLLALLAAVGCLLLIACANVANLLLARSTARAREMAVRAAIGASRARLVRQLLIESLLLALLGGALGASIAEGGLGALLALAPDTLPRAGEIALDGRALAFTLTVALSTGVGFGLVPAFQVSRVRPHDSLKESGRASSDGTRRGRLRSTLVVSEVAIALVLLSAAGLLMRSFVRLQEVEPGFRPDGVLAAHVPLPRPKYLTDQQYVDFSERTMALLRQVPGVQVVATSRSLPFTEIPGMTRTFGIVGRPEIRNENMPLSRRHSVGPEYFRAMGIPLLRGRLFDARDNARPRAVIVNDFIARTYFASEDPLGKRISLFEGPAGEREIVGVVGDVKPGSLMMESLPEI